MRPARRPSRLARTSRLEALEGRALLSSAAAEPFLSPWIEAVAPAPAQFSRFAAAAPAESAADQEAGAPRPPWRLAMIYPWRIASWRHLDGPAPFDRPEAPEAPRPALDPSAATVLSPARQVRLQGAVAPGGEGDLFGIPIGPSTRALRISYQIQRPESAEGMPVRVLLGDANGEVLASWWLDPSVGGLDLRMLALVPPEPTMLYFGIEAAWGPPEVAIPYALEIQSGAAAAEPGRVSVPIGWPAEGPSWDGSEFTTWGGLEELGPARLGSLDLAMLGPGAGPAGFGASGGPGLGLGFLEVEAPAAASFGSGLVRPLPIQSASAVGGLLPAGPLIRGEGEVSPRIDDFADPLLAAASPIDPPDSADGPAVEQGGPPAEAGGWWADPELMAEAGDAPIGAAPGAGGISRLAGPGGLPMLVAGLRIARGRPEVPSRGEPAPPPPDELVAIAVAPPAPPPPPSGPGVAPSGPRQGEAGAEPTRPRVLRTALIGAAALAVGLLLPDLASERPLMLARRAAPPRRWRGRPRTA